MKKFIRGRIALRFKNYKRGDFNRIVESQGWTELTHLCGMYSADGRLVEAGNDSVFFEYKVVRPSMRECREFVKALKTKLKDTYRVRVDETLVMSGDSW